MQNLRLLTGKCGINGGGRQSYKHMRGATFARGFGGRRRVEEEDESRERGAGNGKEGVFWCFNGCFKAAAGREQSLI
jgi:hypothetical protein